MSDPIAAAAEVQDLGHFGGQVRLVEQLPSWADRASAALCQTAQGHGFGAATASRQETASDLLESVQLVCEPDKLRDRLKVGDLVVTLAAARCRQARAAIGLTRWRQAERHSRDVEVVLGPRLESLDQLEPCALPSFIAPLRRSWPICAMDLLGSTPMSFGGGGVCKSMQGLDLWSGFLPALGDFCAAWRVLRRVRREGQEPLSVAKRRGHRIYQHLAVRAAALFRLDLPPVTVRLRSASEN